MFVKGLCHAYQTPTAKVNFFCQMFLDILLWEKDTWEYPAGNLFCFDCIMYKNI